MKKILLSVFVIVAFAAYVFTRQNTDLSATSASLSASTPPASSDTPTSTPPAAAPPPTSTTTSGFKDGVYTGTASDSFYGPVQVQATIQGGKITSVEALQFPNDRPNSVEVSSFSIPKLKTEAIQKQSGDVSIVTGATDTSIAFAESLQSALQQAK